MQEVGLHFKWAHGSARPVIFGAYATEESARLDCTADPLGRDGLGRGGCRAPRASCPATASSAEARPGIMIDLMARPR